MKLTLFLICFCALLAACTTAPIDNAPTTTASVRVCDKETQIGSSIARRENCYVQSEQVRLEADQRAAAMREEFNRVNAARPAGNVK